MTSITSSNGVFTAAPTTGIVAAGASLTVTVSFAPTAVGPQMGTLTIASNAGTAATVTVSGNGTATPAPIISVSATTVNVGNVTVGSTGTATFTISNSGTAPLVVTGITSSNGVFTAAPITGTVAPGGSLTVTVSFDPTTVAPQTGTLTIASNAATATVTVTGTGTAAPAPVVSVSATSLNLGVVALGNTSTATLVIYNTGNAALTISSISANNGSFTVTPTTGLVAAGDSLTLTITFSPLAIGQQTANLRISSNAPAQPVVTVALIGVGTQQPIPSIAVSTTTVNLGNVTVGTSGTGTLQVYNRGSGPLIISNISFPTALFTVSPTSGTLAPGDSLTVTITFTPLAVGIESATLMIASNDVTRPMQLVGVNATGIAAPTGVFDVATTNLAIGSLAVGSTGGTPFTITNIGGATIPTVTIALSSGPFSVTPATFGPLAPGASITIAIIYAPTTPGPHAATLTISAPGVATVTVNLTADTITGLPGDALAAQLQLYPNPTATGQALVEWTGADQPNASVLVLDPLGRTVRQTVLVAGKLLLTDLSRGVYSLRVTSTEGSATRRLVVE